MDYGFRAGASGFGVRAQVAGERLEALRAAGGGVITPAAVVADARPEGSPLHPAFEWDDAAAAEAHRRNQARRLIRSVVEVVPPARMDDGPAVRQCYVSVGSPVRDGAGYTTSATALGDVELRGRVLGDALRALAGWRQRYAHLEELAHVFAVVDEMEAQAVA